MEVVTKFTSFNMHGFKQGIGFLDELCKSNDVLLLQEHWLTSVMLINY